MKKLLLCGTLIMMCLFDLNSQTLSYPFTNASLAGLTQFGSSLTPTTDRINALTNAVDLNGDYLRTTSSFQDYSFTTSFWVNTSTVDGTKRTIIDHSNKNSNFDNNSDAGWYTYLKNGKVGLAANYWHTHDVSGSPVVAYTGYVYTEATTNIADGYWHNIIVTAQRSIIYTASSEKRYVYSIYIDGVLENTQTVSRYTSSLSNVNCGLVITNKAMTIANNGSSNLTDRYLDKIDDIKYYTSVVSSTVINTLANENRCNTPSNIVFNAITANSANVDWNTNTDALSWDMIYAISGQPMNTGTLVSAIAVSDYSLTSLTQSTTYDVYLKSNCSGFSGWWSIPQAFTTLCPSTFANAIAQNYTVQLNSFGTASITTSNINNGSSVDCGVMNISLSKSTFNCSDVGVNTVTLTVTDNQANTSTATANVTVVGIINNEPLTYNQSSICTGATATIITASSVNGIKYSLRDDATNNIIGSPIIGNGSSLTFTTGVLNSSKTFNILGELQNGGNYGLDFDGTNDVVNTSISTPSTNSLTLEAWIYPRATTVKRIITKFKNVATESGEFILDTYNPTNNGRGLRFYVEGAGSVTHTISVANVLTLNAWNHVATTFNNGVVKLYVNGLAVATNTAPFTSIPSNTATVCFGEDATIGALEYFNGKMDDIRIWNTVRTQTEIAGNMNNCLAGNENGLTNYFKISENTGNTITDLVTNSIGNMSGMTPTTAWTTGNVDCGSNLCEFEMTQLVTITVNPAPVIAVNSGSICAGNNFTITPSGASTYTIQGGSAIKTPTANATYTVTGTSTAGCTSSSFATSTVTVNALPVISVPSTTICAGSTATLTASGANTYTWNTGANTSFITASPASNTTYTVNGTSLQGCLGNLVTASITVGSAPSIALNNASVCAGSSATLIASGVSTYTWNTGATTNSIIVSPTINTTYSVSGNLVGCTNSASNVSNVTVNSLPTIAVNSGSICSGNSFTITPSGASTYTIQGGSAIKTPTSNTTYTVIGTSANGCVSSSFATSSITVNATPTISVNNGSICIGNSFTITPSGANTYTIQGGNTIVNPTANATYTVAGTGTNGCISNTFATSNVTVNATPTITVNSGSICEGESFTITPNGANTYTIQGGNAIVNPTTNATYTVIGTSANGCVSSSFATANVSVNAAPTIIVNSGSICEGESFTITPSGASTYTFSNGNIVNPLVSTNYTVTGTGTNGCVNLIGSVSSVTVNMAPIITAANGAICIGNSFTLSPSGASTYTYSSGSAVVSPTSTSTYTISGTSAAGCISSTSAIATVTVSNTLNVVINGNNTVCNGQTVNLTAGGAATYTWNTGATSSTIVPSPTTNTTYSVIGASGTCSNTAVITVTVNPLPSISAVSNETLICVGETATLTASGASTYTWNSGGVGTTISVSPNVTTTYTVTGTDINGCENNSTVTQDVSMCTGINNITNNYNAMTLFPNPSSSILTIQSIEEIKEIYIFNTLGDLVRTEKTKTFSIEQLSSGIYMIHVKTEKGMNTLRFIRE